MDGMGIYISGFKDGRHFGYIARYLKGHSIKGSPVKKEGKMHGPRIFVVDKP